MKESRTAYAGKNVISGMMAKVLLIVLEFVSRAVFIKYLGEELLGINGVFANIIQILSLAELGMNNVVNFSFYKPIAEKDTQKVTRLIKFYKKIYNFIAISVLVIGLLVVPFLDYIVNTTIKVDNLSVIYLVFLADTVFSYLFVYKATLLRADQKGYILTKYEMISNVVRVFLQIAAMYLFGNIIIYLLIKVIVSVVTNGISAIKAEKEYPYIKNDEGELDKKEKTEIFNTIKSGFIYKIAGILLNSTDNVLISMILGTIWVGYLANYNTIITGLSSFYAVIFTSLTASIGNLVVLEAKEKKLEIFEIMLVVSSWLAIVFSVCLFVLSGEFVTLWIGEKFILDDGVVLAKVLMLYLSCSLQPLFCYREALGLYRKTKYVMLAAAVINIVLSIVMGYMFGLAGILFASIIAMLLTYLWYEPVILYKECFEIGSKVYFVQRIGEVISMLFALVVLNYVNTFIPATTWITWFIKAVVLFVIINIYCWLLFRKSNGYTYILNKIKEKMSV